jgi:hypothetical protein
VEGSLGQQLQRITRRGPNMHGSSWEVTPPASLSSEVQGIEGDSSWPALAA